MHPCVPQSIAQEARNREEEEKGFYVYGPFQEHSQKVVEALSKIISYEILFQWPHKKIIKIHIVWVLF